MASVSFQDEIQMLRTINQISFEDEMLGKYKMDDKDVQLFRFIKRLCFKNGKLAIPNYCSEHSRYELLSVNTRNIKNQSNLVASTLAFLKKHENQLPLIEGASIKEKLWHLDKSQFQYAIEAIDSYIHMAANIESDDNYERNISLSLDYLYRSYKVAETLEKQLKKDASKLNQVENFKSDIIKTFDGYLSFRFENIASRIKFVTRVTQLSIHDECQNFPACIDDLLSLDLTLENDLHFINSLYPELLKIQHIDLDLYFNKIFDYATKICLENPCRSEEILRNLNKFCIEKNHDRDINLQPAINKATLLCKEELLKPENIITKVEIGMETQKPNLENKDISEVMEFFFNLNIPSISKSRASNAADSTIINKISTQSVHDSENRLRANNRSSKNQEKVNAYSSLYVQLNLAIRESIIRTALLSIAEQPTIEQQSLRDYFSDNFPSAFSMSLADSLFFLLKGQFHIALPVLVPRMETILKHAINDIGASTTTTQSDMLDDAKGLEKLVEFSLGKNLINDNDAYLINLLLIDEDAGNIVRHEISHGSLSDTDMNNHITINAAYLIFKLAYQLTKNNSSQTSDNSE